MSETAVRYLVTGFTQNTGVRVYAFDGIAPGWVKTAYSVQADLGLARKYGIQMQELPLLCRSILERRGKDDDQCSFTFTEDDMTVHAQVMRAEAEASKKKPSRKAAAAAMVEPASIAQAQSA